MKIKTFFIVLLLVGCLAMQKGKSVLTCNTARGFNGPVPVKVYVTAGRIDSVQVLPNQETPSYLNYAKQGILPRFKGKTVEEARNMRVDAVSGATYSSKAIISNIKGALK